MEIFVAVLDQELQHLVVNGVTSTPSKILALFSLVNTYSRMVTTL